MVGITGKLKINFSDVGVRNLAVVTMLADNNKRFIRKILVLVIISGYLNDVKHRCKQRARRAIQISLPTCSYFLFPVIRTSSEPWTS